MKIKGEINTRNVWIDGKYLDPMESQKVHNHSPDGFAWGNYGGSGPSQLALAILLTHFLEEVAVYYYHDFKWDTIANLPPSDFEIEVDLDEWLKKQKEKNERRNN